MGVEGGGWRVGGRGGHVIDTRTLSDIVHYKSMKAWVDGWIGNKDKV